MAGHHAQARQPRAHWFLLAVVLSLVSTTLFFEGWSTHQVFAAPDARRPCAQPAPPSVTGGGPVVRIEGDTVKSASMPPHTVALTYDGGPHPVWTPRLLDLLREHHAHATFFLNGAQVTRHPALVRRILAEGHEIGSSGYTGAILGSVSPLRADLELAFTRAALEGATGVSTHLLRMPRTTSVDTLCGAEWRAARRAAGDGYVLVAADRPRRGPALGVVRQLEQDAPGYRRTERLLRNPEADEFTTVTAGLGRLPANEPASVTERWRGTRLLWFAASGHALATALAWVLGVAGVLGLLRAALLLLFSRTHLRRLRRPRPGAPWLRHVAEPVTVLVPAYNEEAGIATTVRSLLASTHTALQIIVIDDGSGDRTAEIVASIPDPRVTLVRQANAGKAAALNTGLAHARHDIVVMVDGDTVFEPDAIRWLVQPLAHPAIGAVSGNIKVANRSGLLGRWQHLEYVAGCNLDVRMFEVLECMPTVPGAIGAFRREALMGVGGISEDTLAEDTDLTMALWRAGWKVVYEERAVAWTEVPRSVGQLWRQRYRWCYGTLQAMWKHRRAVTEVGSTGRFARRALTYIALFQVMLPLLAPLVDIFAVYGLFRYDTPEVIAALLGFLALQLAVTGYALRLDGERLGGLWVVPLQSVFYRQLLYLVVLHSVVTALSGVRLPWHRMHRSGLAGLRLGHQAPAPAPAPVKGRHRSGAGAEGGTEVTGRGRAGPHRWQPVRPRHRG
ncbi:bifunctional polysaccharide deacetylase/glycosyltransferase family 2 protein [Streptomyces cucumeris]|uniref:bifunctional polysaccharide deacetylase/glycosyltransferase family 2 protein n=1 Tax=Streptomyces cucumeris TaxID=2962890 RepID=UPI0020C8D347|nr:bifunctional polysaccharide deacetylase/glycosyltransferase family 2 protein [Streptomyces sp. NEAU-Y11]MCP9206718.1 bifunctional polysaccharide deacetylase/glycosyltransferase family 2 protein [Streptomyces sp. NEAU-Y11]